MHSAIEDTKRFWGSNIKAAVFSHAASAASSPGEGLVARPSPGEGLVASSSRRLSAAVWQLAVSFYVLICVGSMRCGVCAGPAHKIR